jgi:hypothetical protein
VKNLERVKARYLALELPLVDFKVFVRERYFSWISGDRSLV